MRIMRQPENSGYTLWLSRSDTYDWAHRPGNSWPCSVLSDHRVVVCVDRNGLVDRAIDGKTDMDCDNAELMAIVSDNLPEDLHHLWPVWA